MADILSAEQQLVNDHYVAATLGTYIHKEDFKADGVLTKDGRHAETHFREADQLAVVKLAMPYGPDTIWKQTEIVMDPETGAKLMQFERRNADQSIYLGKNGKPQAVIEVVGNIGTDEDIAAFTKLVKGQDNPRLFQKAAEISENLIAHEQQRSAANGVPMPTYLLAGHSMGNYLIGVPKLALQAQGLEVTRTIEIEPVGAGAGLRHLAQRSANPEATANLLADNVASFRAPETIFHTPGGWGMHDNAMVGQTYEYKGAPAFITVPNVNLTGVAGFSAISNPINLIMDHTLALAANDMIQQGVAGMKRTPERDTPINAILHDMQLPLWRREVADGGVEAFSKYTVNNRGTDYFGDVHTAPTDLHAAAAPAPAVVLASSHSPGLHEQNVRGRTARSYVDMKVSQTHAEPQIPHITEPAPAHVQPAILEIRGVEGSKKTVNNAHVLHARFDAPM